MACRNCGSAPTIRAHIIPKSFAREARGDGKHIASVTWDHSRSVQSGFWDDCILCTACDGVLGAFDKYAIEVCRAHANYPFAVDRISKLFADGSKLAKFVNAVIWRSSISQHSECSDVDLAERCNSVKNGLFGCARAGDLLPVFALPYKFSGLPPLGFYTHPVRHLLRDKVTAYSFSLGGFRFTAILEAARLTQELRRLVINDANPPLTCAIPFSETSEFETMLELAALHRKRRNGRF